MAALGFQMPSESPVTVMVEVNKAQFALCTLQAGRIPQQPLDLNFTEGEEVTFFTEGNGDVHLTGKILIMIGHHTTGGPSYCYGNCENYDNH